MIEYIDGVAYTTEKPEEVNNCCNRCALVDLSIQKEPCRTCSILPDKDVVIYRVATLRDHIAEATK